MVTSVIKCHCEWTNKPQWIYLTKDYIRLIYKLCLGIESESLCSGGSGLGTALCAPHHRSPAQASSEDEIF